MIEVTVKKDGVVVNQFTLECDTPTIPPIPPDDNLPPNTTTLENGVSLKRESISKNGVRYYAFEVPQGKNGMQVSMSTYDWETNQDMMISYGLPYPTTDDYIPGTSFNTFGPQKWAKITPGSSNETIYFYTLQAGTYYIMVNNTSDRNGSYGIGFSTW